MTINPRIGMWLSIALAVIAYFAGAGSLMTTIFGEHTTSIILAALMLLLGAGNSINAVLHMIPSQPGPVGAAQFPLGPPTIPAVVKAAIILAILILGTLIVPTTGYAQNKQILTGNPIRDIQNLKGGTQSTSIKSSTGCGLSLFTNVDVAQIVEQIQGCIAADLGKAATGMLPDWQGALDSATAAKDTTALNCLTPAFAIIKAAAGTGGTPAIPGNPTATPPVPDTPAVAPTYPGPVTLFQKVREFGLAGGIPACRAALATTAAMLAPIQ